MEKKLFRVKIVLYAMADNAADAYAVASRVQFENMDCSVSKAENVEPEWADVIPYNADNNHTCSEILSKKQRLSRPEIFTRQMPSYNEPRISVFNLEN